MEGMAEGSNHMREASARQSALDFRDKKVGLRGMLENGIAFDASEDIVAKRKLLGVGNDVHTGKREKIQIYVSIHSRTCSTNVEIPAAQRRINIELGGIMEERGWGSQCARETFPPARSGAIAIQLCDGRCVRVDRVQRCH
jgi:hypothetical protein